MLAKLKPLRTARLLSSISIANRARILRSGTQYAYFHNGALLLAPETVKVPQMAESITEGTLKQWQKSIGDHVEVDEEVATIETDKIDVSVNAPVAGTIVELLADEEATVTVGEDLFRIEPGEGGGGAASAESSKESTSTTPPPPKEESKDLRGKEPEKQAPSPQAEEKRAEQADPGKPPLKQGGETLREEKQTTTKKDATPSPPPKKEEKKPAYTPPPPPGTRSETRVKMSRMRLRIAERLKQSQNAAASLTTFNEIDMSAIMSLRSSYKDDVLKRQGVKLGFMSPFARACVLALKEIPAANASIDGDEIVYRDYVDLSVAVATPKGLVTPVVRNIEGMGFVDIERAIAELGVKARDGKLTIEEMAGGTFTISNGGVFGSLYGTPIINLPQAAVLGMHAIKDKAVVIDGKVEVRPVMVVALTYDHRLLDGREAVTFLVRVKEYIEDPRRMLL